jgi:D-2-hydroxyacid dehydrogenase (NADP+)
LPTKVLITYRMSPEQARPISETYPELKVILATERATVLREVADADVVYAGLFNAEVFKAARKLRWVQAHSAGVDRFCRIPDFVESPVVLTNTSGVHAIPISEHVFGLMLAITRQLKVCFDAQNEKKWTEPEVGELYGQTLGVIGLGSIGSEVARKAKCFGMKVLATKREAVERPDYVDELLPATDLKRLLRESDFSVICLPLTPDTRGLIDEEALKEMKPTAWIINIARGGIIDENALIRVLKQGTIGGAALDVFSQEPLPESSELWTLSNVLITPHAAGSSPRDVERCLNIFLENIGRFVKGQPMINVVDKRAGY